MNDDERPPEICEFCGDAPPELFLLARCHPTAPLRVRKEGPLLILTCYLPDCGRELARFQIYEPPVAG